jgi:Zn-finger nucleic acid-binding protein
MDCPRCRTPLQIQNAGRLVMNCCFQCGGLFLDGASSKRVVEAVDPNAIAAANQVSQHAKAPVATDAIAPCPVCQKALDRMPIPAASVTVDVCAEHGVWFDRDELQRVVSSVAGQPQQPPMNNPAMQPPQQPLPPGMAQGQYVAPGWLDESAQKPFGGMPQMGQPMQQQQPGQQQGGWGVGKTALAVGGGVAAVAGVAYLASHTDLGKQVMGVGPHASGFGAVGNVLSKLF